MNVTRCLHELAKETDRITEVGSSDREIDEASDQLMIVSRLTCCGARVGIQFEVSIEWGCDRFTLSHPELV